MPYVFLDDGFHSNPKIVDAGLDGSGLYARALSYCGHYLTDGWLSRPALLQLAEQKPKLVARCVDVGLFVLDGDRYHIPDYLDANPSRAEVEARREQKRKAGRKSAAVRAGVATPVEQPLEQNASETATRAGAQTGAAPSPALTPKTKPAEQSLSAVRPAALPNESLEELGQRLEAATPATPNGRAPYGSVDSVYEVIDKPAGNTRRELEKWLPLLAPNQVEHVREQTLACEPRKSKAAYAVGTAQKLARERGAA